ncbi:hypothetical protein, partial [Klebsiella pneumoniae]|uniref:hypothetical protein n=1 Tax=Klebsiella pneumoniae TaxID=573 RepID=UPI001C58C851
GLTALSAEFTIGEGELMAHDVPLGCAPDEYDDLISGTCSHLPKFAGAIGVKECYLFADKYTFVHVSLSYITDNHRLLINSH